MGGGTTLLALWLALGASASSAYAQSPEACVTGAFDGGGSPECLAELVDGQDPLKDAPAAVTAAPRTRWELDVPANPGPGGAVPPADSPSGPEWQRFWDRLQNQVFDNICKNLKLPLNQDFRPAEAVGVNIGIERSLARYPDKKIAIVDRAKLGLSLGQGIPLTGEGAPLPITFSVDARLEGQAYVIRTLDSTSDCSQIGKLLDILDFKTVFPVGPERLANMQLGELWKLPLVLRAGVSLGGSMSAGPASFAISLSASQSEVASVTLLRLSQEALRLRVRLDRANVKNLNTGVSLTIPVAGPLGLEQAENIVEKQVDRALLRELNRYLATSLAASYWKHDGRKALLEFVLDPRDPEQMARLSDFLKGNISALAVLLRTATAAIDPRVRHGEIPQELAEIERRNAERLGAKSAFAGASDYDRTGRSSGLRIPLVVRHDSGEERQSDRIVTDARDTRLNIHQASTRDSNAWIDIPLLGQMFKKDEQQIVQTMTRVDENGFPQETFMAYIQQEGHVRHREGGARRMVESANEIMRLAGVRGERRDERGELPTRDMFPARDGNPMYRSAVSAFTVVFNRQAIQEILWAPAEVVLKAFMNAVSDEKREMLAMVLGHAQISESGDLELDKGGLRRELWRSGLDSRDTSGGQDLFYKMTKLAKQAAGFIKDLFEARAGDWEARARALAGIASGKGRSGLKYAEAMKVLVQLSDADNLFGEFRIQTNKKIQGEKDVSARYLFNRDKQDAAFNEAIQLKARFADPSLLGD